MSQEPPVPPQPADQPPPTGGNAMAVSSGFFGALFDFNFDRFITPMIVKAVYLLALILLAVGWFVIMVTSFTQSVGLGLVVLILGPVVVVVYLAFIRMTLEFYLAIVRMSQDIHQRLPRA